MRKRSRWFLVAVALGALLWITAVFWGSHSEGFQFAEGKIRISHEIQSLVGNVRKVELPVFGHYREKFVGSDKWVKMAVHVEGDKGAVTINIALEKMNNAWTITESSIGDHHIDLN